MVKVKPKTLLDIHLVYLIKQDSKILKGIDLNHVEKLSKNENVFAIKSSMIESSYKMYQALKTCLKTFKKYENNHREQAEKFKMEKNEIKYKDKLEKANANLKLVKMLEEILKKAGGEI